MKKLLTGFVSALVVDAYLWDFTLTVFPVANSKMILAVIGIFAFLLKGFEEHGLNLTRRVVTSAFLAFLFSFWCYIAITLNSSNEMAYVTYFASFATWVGGAYGAYTLLKRLHGTVDLMLITRYIAIVCVFQCGIALLIDNVAAVKSLVQSVFLAGYAFYERVGRLYGIGCALDPAGVRFSAILVLIAHQLVVEERVRASFRHSSFLFIAFLIITVIGSMIARTTIVGTGLGLAYLAIGNLRVERGGLVSRLQLMFSLLLLTIVAATVGLSIYLYHSSGFFHEQLRFGFEGFFNWVETGEFRTHSTDILMETMWVWPDTRRGWIIGEGRIGVFDIDSDIGYCNFVFYCGLIGLTIYSIYYIYNHLSLISKFRRFTVVALLLCAVTFIIWAKVMTDIFLIDALLFCIDGDRDRPPESEAPEPAS